MKLGREKRERMVRLISEIKENEGIVWMQKGIGVHKGTRKERY